MINIAYHKYPFLVAWWCRHTKFSIILWILPCDLAAWTDIIPENVKKRLCVDKALPESSHSHRCYNNGVHDRQLESGSCEVSARIMLSSCKLGLLFVGFSAHRSLVCQLIRYWFVSSSVIDWWLICSSPCWLQPFLEVLIPDSYNNGWGQ